MANLRVYRYATVLCFLAGAGGPAIADTPPAFTLEQLLAEPSIAGTAPVGPAWSPDGKHVAFLWNDSGRPLRDIWRYTPSSRELKRLTTLGSVSEVAWLAPKQLAFVSKGSLYALGADGVPAPMEPGKNLVRNLQVSPDGRYLAFITGGPDSSYLHTFDGDGALWVRDANSALERAATRLIGDDIDKTFVESYQWSDDSRRIAFVLGDNRGVPEKEVTYDAGGKSNTYRVSRSFPGEDTTVRRLGTVDVADTTVRWFELENDRNPIWNYELSSDGSRLLANTSDYVVKKHTVYVFDVESGARTRHYHHEDPTNVVPRWRAAWAPRDEGLIILTDKDGYYHLYHQPGAEGPLRQLTQGSWEIASFRVDPKGERIFFVANEAHPAERQLYSVGMSGGKITRLTANTGTYDPTYATDFRGIALLHTSDTSPVELAVLSPVKSGAERRVTHSPLPKFDTLPWAKVTYPEFRSHVDGTPLVGRLMVPRDFDPTKRYPLIVGSVYSDTVVNQWGRGPVGAPAWALDQYLVNRGYLVLKVNVRGSWGHGNRSSSGLLGKYGGIDIEDIESGVRHLIDQGFVDKDRVGIWGNSYGGLMTSMSLFKKPGVYAAGIAGAPATNVAHAYPGQMWVMGEPKGADFPARYERQSALYQSAGLEDPYMIIHGTRDVIVLYSDTIALAQKLIDQNKSFELVTLPGANHGWDRDTPEQALFAYTKMVDFFDRHVMQRQSTH